MTEQNDKLLLTEIAKLLYFIRTSTTKYPRGSSWDKCKNKKLWISNADMVLAKARPIIEKQQQAKDTEYYAEMMKTAVDRVRRVAEKQEREKITPDVEEVIRVLAKVVPHDQNAMIRWAVKSQDSVYTNAGAAYRLLLALKQVLKKEE